MQALQLNLFFLKHRIFLTISIHMLVQKTCFHESDSTLDIISETAHSVAKGLNYCSHSNNKPAIPLRIDDYKATFFAIKMIKCGTNETQSNQLSK